VAGGPEPNKIIKKAQRGPPAAEIRACKHACGASKMRHANPDPARRRRGGNTFPDRWRPRRAERLSPTGVYPPCRRNHATRATHAKTPPPQRIHSFTFGKEMKPLAIESFIAPTLALGIFLAAASVVTALLAYWAISRSKRPSILHAILGGFIAPSFILCCLMVYFDGSKVLSHEYWTSGAKSTPIETFPVMLAILVAACLIPSTLVIIFFQRWHIRKSS